MSELLACVEVGPGPDESAESSVIWLHGLGASGHDFEPVVPHLGLPKTRFVFPHAPQRPVTINMGMVMPAWYDILSMAGSGGIREPIDHVRTSQAQVEALIQRECDRGTPPERIVVAGFSQGGAIANWVGLRYPKALAGIMVLSAYELFPDTLAEEASPANAKTPMLFCHGSLDPMVKMSWGREGYERRAEEDRAVEWHDWPMGHQVCLEEIEVIGAWLRGCLSV